MPTYVPGAWDPTEWEDVQTSTPAHWKTGLQNPGLGNPCVPRCSDCGLIRKRGKGMCEKPREWQGSVLQVRNDYRRTSISKSTILAGKGGG